MTRAPVEEADAATEGGRGLDVRWVEEEEDKEEVAAIVTNVSDARDDISNGNRFLNISLDFRKFSFKNRLVKNCVF